MEAFVDQSGMAHDDEGNSWYVGKRWAGFVGSAKRLPMYAPATRTVTTAQVSGSKGQTYTVSRYPNGRTYCTCKGFQFRKTCKHI